ncbi:MAG: hypothetical protein FWC64_07005 [Treponema sp.]|nr:hypothetical protein [Treponema sp.]
MPHVTLEELQRYSGTVGEHPENQAFFIEAAGRIIDDYLGYDGAEKALCPGTQEYRDIAAVPSIQYLFKVTCLRIATMLQTEGGSNIGVTSKSFGDSGSRTFVNYTNFDKYLLPIAAYRKIRI